jgi:predicted outer membrane repeat protein
MVNGGFLSAYDLTIAIGQYHFKNNSAKYGGVFLIGNTSLTLVGRSDLMLLIVFEDNIATYNGGVIYAYNDYSITRYFHVLQQYGKLHRWCALH